MSFTVIIFLKKITENEISMPEIICICSPDNIIKVRINRE